MVEGPPGVALPAAPAGLIAATRVWAPAVGKALGVGEWVDNGGEVALPTGSVLPAGPTVDGSPVGCAVLAAVELLPLVSQIPRTVRPTAATLPQTATLRRDRMAGFSRSHGR